MSFISLWMQFKQVYNEAIYTIELVNASYIR